ncbi:MAG: hypothetical protein ABIW33_05350 [Sphingomicrobium sp.]
MTKRLERPFASFFQAGFECSSHRRADGVRLDLVRATGHDKHVLGDYRQCRALGLRTVRDGLRWHLIEQGPGRYDWSSWMPALEAAEEVGVEVIWDLFHYGSPDFFDQGAEDFADRFAEFAVAAVEIHQSVSDRPPLLCPMNEINFLSWAVEVGYFPATGLPTGDGLKDGGGLKERLVTAAIGGARAIRAAAPDATLVWAEPLVNITTGSAHDDAVADAEAVRNYQFDALDWITGRTRPELGGDPTLADIVGANFYPHNQWYHFGPPIPLGHHDYRPLAEMLIEIGTRYGKPVVITETGAEGSARAAWLHYVCSEVAEAIAVGADVRGICWYPITAYPGWDNSRHAEAGLLSTITGDGTRHVDERLAAELKAQQERFALPASSG